ncbi:hypothetical protein H257_01175 [Aphanomyces astaci]|uniref:Fungal lipase-type domain-containing protein n=1 Tax=Aphanomyces astaci TaxID=112090 RepID=W4H9A3_APHAT|nr:hypothetical protein H257_01175 [Aphanomyces astaci]ETV87688.1 hypothetical protein H257_01175 [Aphanomyces astaci]|eukprot:XP_009822551.1 hypothetical protein H257_01175 [Aphanomyces astaci]
MEYVRQLNLVHMTKMEALLRIVTVDVPTIIFDHVPFSDQAVKYFFVYIMLQALAILWGFLFNLGTMVGENVIDIVTMPFLQASCVLFVHYAVIGIILGIGRTTWILTWQSLTNFPYIRRIMLRESSPQVVVLLSSIPILLLLVSLILVPSFCTNMDTAEVTNTLCKSSYIRYLTPSYPVFQRSLRLTTVIASAQFLQVVMEILPPWSSIIAKTGTRHLVVLGMSLAALNGCTILWTFEWLLRHGQVKTTSLSDLSQLRWETLGLVLLCLWMVWFLTLVCHSFPLSYASRTDDRSLSGFFRRLKVTFLTGQAIVFMRACVHPQMGFVHAQLELTIINLLLPLFYVFSLLVLRGFYLSSFRKVVVAAPLSLVLAYGIHRHAAIGKGHTYWIISLFLFGAFLRLLQPSRSLFSSADTQKGMKSHPTQRVALRFVLAASGIFTLFLLFMIGFGALTFLQREKEHFPAMATVQIDSDGRLDVRHASVVRLQLTLATASPPPIAPRPPHYASCGNRWFNLSLVDYALLSQAAYFNPQNNQLKDFVASVFPSASALPMFDIRLPENYTAHGSKVEFFEAYSKDLNVSVISVRGTDVGRFRDFIEDAKMYAEPVIFVILSSIFPTIRMWPDVTFSTLIELYHEMATMFGLTHEYWYYHELLQYVKSIHDRNVILTGHSLGGAIARVVGSVLGKPSVSFSPPGSGQTYSKLVHDIAGQDMQVDRSRLHHESTCVLPEYDPVTMIDTQSGLIQRITCDTPHLSMQLSCHMIQGTLCNLLQHCGDDRGRFSSCQFEHRITSLSQDVFEAVFVDVLSPTTLSGLLMAVALVLSLVRHKIITHRRLSVTAASPSPSNHKTSHDPSR